MTKNRLDLEGKKFNRLKVLKFMGTSKPKTKDDKKNYPYNSLWQCQCDCGNIVIKQGTQIKSGKIKSCGCLRKETARKNLLDTKDKRKGKTGRKKIYPRKEYFFSVMVKSYKKNINHKNLKWDLNIKDFIELLKNNCFWCGDLPSKTRVHTRYRGLIKLNGIDRKNNNEGYNKKNCVTCCKTCNYMKRNLSPRKFKNHIAKIYKHSIEK